MNKQDYTVGYIMNILKDCDPEAIVNVFVYKKTVFGNIYADIDSILIHQNDDKKEIISLQLESEDDWYFKGKKQ